MKKTEKKYGERGLTEFPVALQYIYSQNPTVPLTLDSTKSSSCAFPFFLQLRVSFYLLPKSKELELMYRRENPTGSNDCLIMGF